MILSFIAVGFSIATAQASTVCTSQAAQDAGYLDASSGELKRPGLKEAKQCKGSYSAKKYKKDYEAGFAKRREEVCNDNYPKYVGYSDAENGEEGWEATPELRICTENKRHLADMFRNYRRGFIDKFCLEDTLKTVGKRAAQDFKPQDHSQIARFCLDKFQKKFQAAYSSGYESAKKETCTDGVFQGLGKRAKLEKRFLLSKYLDFCPADKKAALQAAFEKGKK